MFAAGGIADERMWSSYGGGNTVTAQDAETVSTVFACIRVRSQTMAKLPKRLYRQTGKTTGERELLDIDSSRVLDEQANPLQTAFEFWEFFYADFSLNGAGFALPKWAGGELISLTSIPSADVFPRRNTSGGWVYEVRYGMTVERYNPDELFRILWRSHDGVNWLKPLEYAANTIRGAMNAERYASSFLGNAAVPSGAIETTKPLTAQAGTELRDGWNAVHGGPNRAGKVAVLHPGMSYKVIAQSMRDSQLDESRKRNALSICAFWGVPPYKVAELENMKFANAEHLGIDFYQDTVSPMAVAGQQAIGRDLLLDDSIYCEFDTDSLIRGDFKTRMEGYASATTSGVLMVNECREEEGRPPVEGGDKPKPPPNASLPAPNQEKPDVPAEKPEPPPDPEAGAYNHLLRSASAKIAATDWKQTGVKSHVVQQLQPIYHLRVNEGRKPESPPRVYDRIAGLADADAVFAHLFRAYG